MPFTISQVNWSELGTIALLVGAGTFALIGAAKNWNWFLRFDTFETLFGRSAARWIYGALGIILIAMGVYAAAMHFIRPAH